MAKGSVINQEALFRAGASRQSTGRNMAAEQHNATMNSIIGTIGGLVKDQIGQGIDGIREYKKLARAKVADMGNGLNASTTAKVLDLKKRYNKAVRYNRKDKAATLLGQLQNLNKYVVADREVLKGTTSKTRQLAGFGSDKKEGSPRHNPGNTTTAVTTSAHHASGQLKERMFWDEEGDNGKGQMMVMMGGAYQADGSYGAINSSEFNTSDGSFLPEEYIQGLVQPKAVPYNEVDFGGAEDNMAEKTIKTLANTYIENAQDDGFHGLWSVHKKQLRSEIDGNMDDPEMTNNRFIDYFFGGLSYNYSQKRMTASAPAFQMLLEADIDAGNASMVENEDSDGNIVLVPQWKEEYGPGSDKWNAARELLKSQDFGPGTSHRKYAADVIYEHVTSKYNETRKIYEATKDAKANNKSSVTASKFEIFLGNEVEIPTTYSAKKDKALITNIAKDSPTVTVNGVEYERVNGAGYDYRAIKDKGGKITSGGDEVTKEYLIRSVSPIYGKIDDGYFGESTYKMPKVKYDPSSNQTTVKQMKAALPKGTNLDRSDEEIRKAYKKYVLSLAK